MEGGGWGGKEEGVGGWGGKGEGEPVGAEERERGRGVAAGGVETGGCG